MKTKPESKRLALTLKAAGLCSLLFAGDLAVADPISEMLDGFKDGGKASLNARARYEYNEVGVNEINGYSIRTRLGYTTGEYEGLKAMVEMEDVSFNNDDDRPGLDVPTTELNQIWISYEGAKLGRQIYVLDDQRFIGHVGWRQNIQTFDALTYSTAPDESSKVNLAYIDAVHRINATSQDLSGIIANGSYKFANGLNLTGFAYLLDFDRPVLASSDTFGFRGNGVIEADEVKYSYMFSYATQVDNSGSVRDFDVGYMAGEFKATFSGVTVGIGAEILEGDGSYGFTTPLATVHKFNGFADQFAGRSLGLGGGLNQGLEDLYLTVGFKAGDIPVTLAYHDFSAENVGGGLGTEINLVAKYKLNDYVTFLTKFADYSTDGSTVVGYGGVDKTVFTFEANLSY